MLAFITVTGNREHNQDCDSVIKVYTRLVKINNIIVEFRYVDIQLSSLANSLFIVIITKMDFK